MSIHPLLIKARKHGNPLTEGDKAILVWQGKTAPSLVDDLHNWEEHPQVMQKEGAGLWSYEMSLAEDAYLEYGFIDPKNGERLADPLNQNRIWNHPKAYNNFFYMPHGGPNLLAQSRNGVAKGIVTSHQIPTEEYVTGSKRSVYLYQPAARGPVPLVVVFDGHDYLRRVRLNIIVDNLIAAKRILPIAMALVQNGGNSRGLEYSCTESTLEFLSECVIPFARRQMELTHPDNGGWGVLGASSGGLMALYTGLRLPQIFGKVLSQSGSFILPDHEYIVADMVRHFPRPKIDIWMDAGLYDWLLKGNRKMFGLLHEKKYKVKYREYSGGHNYTSWQNDMSYGLEDLFKK